MYGVKGALSLRFGSMLTLGKEVVAMANNLKTFLQGTTSSTVL
jgi:hypothetical protein